MVLTVKNPRVDQLIRELTAETGESITVAVITALQEQLEKVREVKARGREASVIKRRLRALTEEIRAYPVIDDRPSDQILGYDQHGLSS